MPIDPLGRVLPSPPESELGAVPATPVLYQVVFHGSDSPALMMGPPFQLPPHPFLLYAPASIVWAPVMSAAMPLPGDSLAPLRLSVCQPPHETFHPNIATQPAAAPIEVSAPSERSSPDIAPSPATAINESADVGMPPPPIEFHLPNPWRPTPFGKNSLKPWEQVSVLDEWMADPRSQHTGARKAPYYKCGLPSFELRVSQGLGGEIPEAGFVWA
jgi:hypothetical protein